MTNAPERGIRRLGTRQVCDVCVHPDDEVMDVDVFGDYGLCERCREQMTSADKCHFVKPAARRSHG